MPMQLNLKPTAAAIEAEMVVIAHKYLGFVDLEVRNWDRMDFKDVHVSSVKVALLAAYEAGRTAPREVGPGLIEGPTAAALLAAIQALPVMLADEFDGEEADGTPKRWRRPFVSKRRIEALFAALKA